MFDSVFRTGKNYYPQVFLEECKYVVKEKKIPKYIIDDIEISSDTDRENLMKKVPIKKIPMKKILMKNILTKTIKKDTNITINFFFKIFLYIYKNG